MLNKTDSSGVMGAQSIGRALLVLRTIASEGLEASCTMAVEGAFPIKALPLHVGIRRPLGVGAGGLAIPAIARPGLGHGRQQGHAWHDGDRFGHFQC